MQRPKLYAGCTVRSTRCSGRSGRSDIIYIYIYIYICMYVYMCYTLDMYIYIYI